MLIYIIILSFTINFIFALGGVGGAVALVPILQMFGFPPLSSKPIGLLGNTLSMIGASISNFKNKRIDFKLGLPIIIASILFVPLGVKLAKILPQKILLIFFIAFLIISSFLMLFFRGSKYTNESNQYKEKGSIILLSLIGGFAGIFSGMLGVGGGSLISPTLILMGFNPKKVAGITAFAVPFSSFVGFITYIITVSISWKYLVAAGISSYIGGILGTIIMQKKLNASTVKKILGVLLLVLTIKMVLKLIAL